MKYYIIGFFLLLPIMIKAQNNFYIDFGMGINDMKVNYTDKNTQIFEDGNQNGISTDRIMFGKDISAYIGLGKEFTVKSDSFLIFFSQIGLLYSKVKGNYHSLYQFIEPYEFDYNLFHASLRGGLRYKLIKNMYIGGAIEIGKLLNPNSKSLFHEQTFDFQPFELSILGNLGYSFDKFNLGFIYNRSITPLGRQYDSIRSIRRDNPSQYPPMHRFMSGYMQLSINYFLR